MDDILILIEQFLAYIRIEKGLSLATVQSYRADLTKYSIWLTNHHYSDLQQVTAPVINHFVQDQNELNAKSRARLILHFIVSINSLLHKDLFPLMSLL